MVGDDHGACWFQFQQRIVEILGRTLQYLVHVGVVVRIVSLCRRRGIPERTVFSSRRRAPRGPAHGKVGPALLAAIVEFLATGWVVPVVDTLPGAQFRDPLVDVT